MTHAHTAYETSVQSEHLLNFFRGFGRIRHHCYNNTAEFFIPYLHAWVNELFAYFSLFCTAHLIYCALISFASLKYRKWFTQLLISTFFLLQKTKQCMKLIQLIAIFDAINVERETFDIAIRQITIFHRRMS